MADLTETMCVWLWVAECPRWCSKRELLRKVVEGCGAVLWRLRACCVQSSIRGGGVPDTVGIGVVKEGRECEAAWLMGMAWRRGVGFGGACT